MSVSSPDGRGPVAAVVLVQHALLVLGELDVRIDVGRVVERARARTATLQVVAVLASPRRAGRSSRCVRSRPRLTLPHAGRSLSRRGRARRACRAPRRGGRAPCARASRARCRCRERPCPRDLPGAVSGKRSGEHPDMDTVAHRRDRRRRSCSLARAGAAPLAGASGRAARAAAPRRGARPRGRGRAQARAEAEKEAKAARRSAAFAEREREAAEEAARRAEEADAEATRRAAARAGAARGGRAAARAGALGRSRRLTRARSGRAARRIGGGRMLSDHHQVALRAARADGARPHGRRGAGADRRAGPPPRHPGPVPRAALRRHAPRGPAQVPARRQGRLLRSPATPADITVLELVELLDGPLGTAPRASSPRRPRPPARCSATTTVADVVERENREAGAAMYYI